jgi:hypothetical protein
MPLLGRPPVALVPAQAETLMGLGVRRALDRHSAFAGTSGDQ